MWTGKSSHFKIGIINEMDRRDNTTEWYEYITKSWVQRSIFVFVVDAFYALFLFVSVSIIKWNGWEMMFILSYHCMKYLKWSPSARTDPLIEYFWDHKQPTTLAWLRSFTFKWMWILIVVLLNYTYECQPWKRRANDAKSLRTATIHKFWTTKWIGEPHIRCKNYFFFFLEIYAQVSRWATWAWDQPDKMP